MTTATTKAAKTDPPPLGKPRMAILKALKAAGKPLSRAEITTATGIKTGFTTLLGHADPDKREAGSLAARGLITIEVADGVTVHAITAAGKKALAVAEKAAD